MTLNKSKKKLSTTLNMKKNMLSATLNSRKIKISATLLREKLKSFVLLWAKKKNIAQRYSNNKHYSLSLYSEQKQEQAQYHADKEEE